MPQKLNNTKNNLNIKNIKLLIKKYPSPFWVYDGDIICKKIKLLKNFDIIRYAQKSCSNLN
ncbi:MAG: diaminopimelate decarboxylase, partial [Buchnera aphidicola]|nr:diaminopimelate decarboxylase [Buchnera aphidicola]